MTHQKEKKDKGDLGHLLLGLIPFSFFLAVIVYTTYVARAEEDPSIEELRQELEEKDDELKAKIKAYNEIIKLKTRQGAALSDQLTSLEAQIKNLEEQIVLNERELKNLESETLVMTERIKQKETLIFNQKALLSELVRGYYDDQAAIIAGEFIVNASRLANPLQDSDWTTQTGEKVGNLLGSVKSLRESLITEQATLLAKKKEADTLKTQLAERNEYLDSNRAQKAALLAKTESEVQKYDTLVDSLQAEREALENEIQDLEAGKVDELDGIPDYNRGLLAYPVKTVRITQSYGKTSYSNHYTSGRHNGIDFGAKTKGKSGDTVMAAAAGKVIGTGDLGKVAYGKWVTIDHGNGLITLYGHLDKISVDKGDRVNRGEKIGEMGNTGDSTGAHLHFTVYAAGSYELVDSKSSPGKKIPIGAAINPSLYLP